MNGTYFYMQLLFQIKMETGCRYFICYVRKPKLKDMKILPWNWYLSAVFASTGEETPSAIVIDKHKTSLNSINNVILNDIHCWSFVNVTKVQIAEKLSIVIFMWWRLEVRTCLLVFRNRIKRIYSAYCMFWCIVLSIKGTCFATTSSDVKNEENMEDVLSMVSYEQELFIFLKKLKILMQTINFQFTSTKKTKIHKIKIRRKFFTSSKEPFRFHRPQIVDLISRKSLEW